MWQVPPKTLARLIIKSLMTPHPKISQSFSTVPDQCKLKVLLFFTMYGKAVFPSTKCTSGPEIVLIHFKII